MAEGNGNGSKAPWWLGIAVAVAVPMASGYIAINRLADQNAQEVRFLTGRMIQLEADRARLDGRAEANRASIIELAGRIDTLMRADNPRINGLEIGLAGLGREFSRAQEGDKARFDAIVEVMNELQRLIAAAVRRTEEPARRDQ